MLSYITSNENKANIAKTFLSNYNLLLEIHTLELPEIQSDDPNEIALYKAEFAYKELQKPLFVTDHFWTITALNGFPGAYMKYINKWLSADDLLQLMKDKSDREVFLHEALCYIDAHRKKVFLGKHVGTVLYEKQGHPLPAQEIISLTGDNISIAKKLETSYSALEMNEVYDNFGEWLTKENLI